MLWEFVLLWIWFALWYSIKTFQDNDLRYVYWEFWSWKTLIDEDWKMYKKVYVDKVTDVDVDIS